MRALVPGSVLSYVGLGVGTPDASLGTLLLDGVAAMRSSPHLLAGPCAALTAPILAATLLGGRTSAPSPRSRSWRR